ncbi:hypothetical protein PV11_06087 [Exophiala sideris]|uniref:Uncharacterized protein n=1 Tax=Exophiala sideris TaxID=1016849 RepID=A0A0D1W637_9EURO|nr:hypothetical protein PV11_06087 [Exophiala sideris]
MSSSNDRSMDAAWKPNGRPESALARDFSAALDEMFNLNVVGALEQAVEEKKDTVQSQKYQLEGLEARLRETDEKLKQLAAKHRRNQSQISGADRHIARTVPLPSKQ